MNKSRDIYLARNRTKRRCNDFMYEAMRNMMTVPTNSASEFAFACTAMALEEKHGKLLFVTDSDRLIINKILVWITSNK